MKKIKGKHVVVLAPGFSILRYKDKIFKFIKDNNPVIFGCQNISTYIVPDYNLWSDVDRWDEFGHLVNNKSVLVFSYLFPKDKIRKFWHKDYLIFKKAPIRNKKNKTNQWLICKKFNYHSREVRRCRMQHKGEVMYGCIRDIGTIAIFWAFVKGASKVTAIGFDGYTLYKKEHLDSKKVGQHYYGKGYTNGFSYDWERKQDWDRYRTFKLLYKYCQKKFGFSFEIITPTIYDEFYNPNILGIETELDLNKWEKPTKEEYDKLKIKNLKQKSKFIDYD